MSWSRLPKLVASAEFIDFVMGHLYGPVICDNGLKCIIINNSVLISTKYCSAQPTLKKKWFVYLKYPIPLLGNVVSLWVVGQGPVHSRPTHGSILLFSAVKLGVGYILFIR